MQLYLVELISNQKRPTAVSVESTARYDELESVCRTQTKPRNDVRACDNKGEENSRDLESVMLTRAVLPVLMSTIASLMTLVGQVLCSAADA